MFKILLATDGSNHALRAAGYVVNLARRIDDAEVTLLHVIDTRALTAAAATATEMGVIPPMIPPEELIETATTILEDTKKSMEDLARPVITRIERGKPSEVICKIAREEGFDVIVMGNRGVGHIAGIVFGSVSDRVMHEASTPVLVYRQKKQGIASG
ncbi:MAG: universal stress protein [Chloroflexi bacterium]|nr:universal stress protein [Chloroflexota bacterium]